MNDQCKEIPFEVLRASPQLEVRKFDRTVIPEGSKWYRNAEDKMFKMISGRGWSFQLGDKPPVPLNINESYFIPAETWYRTIKAADADDLIIQLHKRV